MKTSELAGAQLAEWVARALGYASADSVPSDLCGRVQIDDDSFRKEWEPHEDWAQGGPILDELLSDCFGLYVDGRGETYVRCSNFDNNGDPFSQYRGDVLVDQIGETILIAVMRAYVASKFGDTVPDELPK